jgi:hypothetical protein
MSITTTVTSMCQNSQIVSTETHTFTDELSLQKFLQQRGVTVVINNWGGVTV